MINAPTLNLYWQLMWARILLWVAGERRVGEATPEVHLYLADLHLKLAAEHETAGRHKAAWRHRAIANQHAMAGPPQEPRPAAAMSMPIPQAPIFTDARGKKFDPEPPDDVA